MGSTEHKEKLTNTKSSPCSMICHANKSVRHGILVSSGINRQATISTLYSEMRPITKHPCVDRFQYLSSPQPLPEISWKNPTTKHKFLQKGHLSHF
jgi:hypothetical protein